MIIAVATIKNMMSPFIRNNPNVMIIAVASQMVHVQIVFEISLVTIRIPRGTSTINVESLRLLSERWPAGAVAAPEKSI
jgi:hypothetical protein